MGLLEKLYGKFWYQGQFYRELTDNPRYTKGNFWWDNKRLSFIRAELKIYEERRDFMLSAKAILETTKGSFAMEGLYATESDE